jgi:hypothetical protein
MCVFEQAEKRNHIIEILSIQKLLKLKAQKKRLTYGQPLLK